MIKNFDKKQIPIAVGSVVAVVAVMICILVFGKTITPSVEPSTTEETTTADVSASEEVPTEPDTAPTTTTTAPTTTAPIPFEDKGAIVLQGDRAMEVYSVASKSLASYAELINSFASHLPSVNVYVLLAPTAMEFYGPEAYRTGGHSQAKGIGIAYGALSGANVKSVDAYSEIAKHTDEYIYFRTDHHWTARGAYYAYCAFASTAGFTPTNLADHRSGKIDGFVGSMYTYTSAEVLMQNPDYVEYFHPLTEATGYIYTDATMTNGRPLRIITEQISGKNKYLAFLEGDNPVEKITTANKNGKKIAVVKESYGNAFAPFLIDNFEEVYVLDPRRGDVKLHSFVKANGITDVMFINYPFAPSNPTYKKALKTMLA